MTDLQSPPPFEASILAEVSGLKLSPSHDQWHTDLVLKFAYQLQAIHGGDLDIINAAVLMHDLGRRNPDVSEKESINSSVAQASKILEKVSFPPKKIDGVLQAIQDHDKPDVKPKAIEGRILKDADFLAGFGAWGILRIAMWAGETGGGIDKFFELVKGHMPKRIEGLEFPESKRFAVREKRFVNLFVALLDQNLTLD